MDNNSKQTFQIFPILTQSEFIFHCGPVHRCLLQKVNSPFLCLEIIDIIRSRIQDPGSRIDQTKQGSPNSNRPPPSKPPILHIAITY